MCKPDCGRVLPSVSAKSGPSIEEMLSDRPELQALFEHISSFIVSLADVEPVARKTHVAYRRRRAFAWIWLPPMWIRKQPRQSVTLAFSLDHRVSDPRIKESVEPYPGRFMHHVVIGTPSDLDERVESWVREAYDLAGAGPVRGQRA